MHVADRKTPILISFSFAQTKIGLLRYLYSRLGGTYISRESPLSYFYFCFLFRFQKHYAHYHKSTAHAPRLRAIIAGLTK